MSPTSRHRTRKIKVGPIEIGGDAPISVQSMTKTRTTDVTATVDQIRRLEAVGCELVRVAVPDDAAAASLSAIRRATRIALAADVHFDYRLALAALDAGVDKLRINPGNIGGAERVAEVARAAAAQGVPIRIGVNAGSLDKDLRAQVEQADDHDNALARAMVESARRHIRLLEDTGFCDIIIALKASSVRPTVEAYRLMAERSEYPLHVGVTEAGTRCVGTVKSAVGIGILLAEGIGDTIRVSLTAPPEEEVRVGYAILGALGLRHRGAEVTSCPTCGRLRIDVARIAEEVERRAGDIGKPLRIAVMGCEVNGPGEARDADVGIAGGEGCGLLFVKGEIMRKVPEDEIVDALIAEVRKLAK